MFEKIKEVWEVSKLIVDQEAAVNSNEVIKLMIALFVTAVVLPISITQMANVTTTDWSTTDIAIFGMITTVALLGLVMGFLKSVKT